MPIKPFSAPPAHRGKRARVTGRDNSVRHCAGGIWARRGSTLTVVVAVRAVAVAAQPEQAVKVLIHLREEGELAQEDALGLVNEN